MSITEVKVFQYNLPLKTKLTVRKTTLTHRQGFLLQITNDSGTSGIGEIAPLPGVSVETLRAVQDQISKIRTGIIHQIIPKEIERLDGKFESWLKRLGLSTLSSSVRFGLEMAVLNLEANSKNIPTAKLICKDFEPHVPINGLLQGSTESICEQAREMIARGYRTVKLKVGSQHLEQDIAKVKALNEVIRDKSLLRLDANQAWTLEQAIEFGNAIGLATVEYIEEPFADTDQIPEFYEKTLIPVALDETLQKSDLKHIKSIEGVEVLVIKPTILGGIERVWQLAQKAKYCGLHIVISSSFETGLGLFTLANLAACISCHGAAGLDTQKWFKQDLLASPFTVEHGYLDILKNYQNPVDLDLLEEVLP